MEKRGNNQSINYNLFKDKKAQVTIFIIIGIALIALIVLSFLYFPQIGDVFTGGLKDPSEFFEDCIEEDLKETTQTISLRGGNMDPELFYPYYGEKLSYLCYTNEYYVPCVVQEPMLKTHIEKEIKQEMDTEIKTCKGDLESYYADRGYGVKMEDSKAKIKLLPERIALEIDGEISLSKGGETQTYEGIEVSSKTKIYELASIATSIVGWESKYGDSETTTFMNYYHDIKVEKKKQTDGTTVYILTNRDTQDKFQFASRSVAWPPA